MIWLLQNNYVERLTGKLAWALQRTGRQIHDFSVLPGQPLPAFPLEPGTPHFFYGSTGLLQQIRRAQGWFDHVFDDEQALDQRHWQAHVNTQLLNAGAQFMTLSALKEHISNDQNCSFFIRPVLAQKAFTGHVVRQGDLSAVFLGPDGQSRQQPADLLLAVSPAVSNLMAEYRFIIYKGDVKLGSRYRLRGQPDVAAAVPSDVWSGAQAMARIWTPASFTVMDVAVLENDQLRIVEFNSVHSSGLYDINPESFAELVEEAVRSSVSAQGDAIERQSW